MTLIDLMIAVEQERDNLRRQVAQLDQANVTLSGQNTDLASENAHLRVNKAAQDQEIVAAYHAQKRLRAAHDAVTGKVAGYVAGVPDRWCPACDTNLGAAMLELWQLLQPGMRR